VEVAEAELFPRPPWLVSRASRKTWRGAGEEFLAGWSASARTAHRLFARGSRPAGGALVAPAQMLATTLARGLGARADRAAVDRRAGPACGMTRLALSAWTIWKATGDQWDYIGEALAEFQGELGGRSNARGGEAGGGVPRRRGVCGGSAQEEAAS